MTGPRKAVHALKAVALLLPFSFLLVALPASWFARRQPAANTQASVTSHPTDRKRLASVLSSLPSSFEPNRGQSDPSVKFLSRGPGYALFLTPDEAVLSLPGASAKASQQVLAANSDPSFSTLRLKFLDANRSPQIEGLDLLPRRSNYFLGNDPSGQRSGVPNFARVRYRSVYPGVDLVFHGDSSRLEFDLDVAPGADIRRARLRLDGAESIRIDPSGDLIASLHSSELRLHRPISYQHTANGDRPVSGQFTLTAKNEIGFQMDGYDASLPLVIDPVLSYSTFLGGTAADQLFGVAVDPQGNFYVAGQTASSNIPVTGAFQGTSGGFTDAFVAKFNADGSGLVYCTYLGGNLIDIAQAIAVDANGSAYVTGFTSSTNFPTKNPLQAALKGQQDIFVTKLSPDGASLVFSTYLGGSALDTIAAIALDAQDDVVLAGTTKSTDFPVVNALEPTLTGTAGNSDAFVAKLSADGSHLIFSTYLGGTSVDGATGVAVDSQGNILVSGGTDSTDFPTSNALQPTAGGGPTNNAITSDAFLTKLNPSGTAVLFSTYWGGTGSEQATNVSVDSSDNIFLVGETTSTDFPTLNPLEGRSPNNGAQITGFVTKFKSDGSSTLFSTYFGGTGSDTIFGSAVDPNGNLFLSGNTTSTDLPVNNAIQSTYGGGASDGFVSEISANGSSLLFSTFLGGTGTDAFNRVAADQHGVYVVGSTTTADFPTAGTPANAFMGSTDGVVVKLSTSTAPAASFSPTSLTFNDQVVGTPSSAQTLTLNNTGAAPLVVTGVSFAGDFSATNTNCPNSLAAGSSCTFNVVFTPTATGARAGKLTLTDNASDSPQTVNLSGNGIAGTPMAGVSPGTLTFTSQLVGSASGSQPITLSNAGTAALTITSASASGDFSQTNNCNGSVAANASCTFTVTFTPTASGARNGSLTITDNATGSPQTVTLTGTGADFTVVPVSGSSLSATVSRGQTASYSLNIAPTGGVTGTLSFACSGAPSESTCMVSPASTPTNGTAPTSVGVSVTTTPPATAAAPAFLGIPENFSPLTPSPFLRLLLCLSLTAVTALAIFVRKRNVPWIPSQIWQQSTWRFAPTSRRGALAAALLALLAITFSSVGCANGTYGAKPDPGTPVGSYSLTITATFTSGASTLKHNITLTMNVQ